MISQRGQTLPVNEMSAMAGCKDSPTSSGRSAIADAVRGIAILFVVLGHLVTMTRPNIGGVTLDLPTLGFWGVAAFFTLSGYLLSASYIRSFLGEKKRMPSMRLFLLRRFYRIFPLYFAAVIISAVIDVLFHVDSVTAPGVLTHLLMLQNFSARTIQTINGPLWTMPIDAQFYICFPILAAWLALICKNFNYPKRSRYLVLSVFTVIMFSIAFRLFIVGLVSRVPYGFFIIMQSIVGLAFVFASGILLAVISYVRHGVPLNKVIASICLIGSLVCIFTSQQKFMYESLNTVYNTVSVFLLLLGLPSFSVVHRLAESRYITNLAALAYAIYLIHLPILQVVSNVLGRPSGNEAFLKISLVGLLIIVPVALSGHKFIEQPFLNIKDGLREKPS